MATYPREVAQLVEALLAGIREALRDNLIGAYLTGSLALGGFDPATSDVDLLAVTARPLSEREFAELEKFHQGIPPLGNRFLLEYEIYYLDRQSLRCYMPGQRMVRVEPGYGMYKTEERPNWVLERWTVREHGITLLGHDPRSLIDAVSEEDIRTAAAGELLVRLQNWSDGTWPKSDLAHRGAQGFEIETACRVLYALETGRLCSKREALAWGGVNLPRERRSLMEWAERVRKDRTADNSRLQEALDFVHWAASSCREE